MPISLTSYKMSADAITTALCAWNAICVVLFVATLCVLSDVLCMSFVIFFFFTFIYFILLCICCCAIPLWWLHHTWWFIFHLSVPTCIRWSALKPTRLPHLISDDHPPYYHWNLMNLFAWSFQPVHHYLESKRSIFACSEYHLCCKTVLIVHLPLLASPISAPTSLLKTSFLFHSNMLPWKIH